MTSFNLGWRPRTTLKQCSIRRNLDGGFPCKPTHLQHIYLKLLVKLIVNYLVVNKKRKKKIKKKEILSWHLEQGKPVTFEFYPTIAVFWKVTRLRQFVFLVRATCRWKWMWGADRMTLRGENRITGIRRETCCSAYRHLVERCWQGTMRRERNLVYAWRYS